MPPPNTTIFSAAEIEKMRLYVLEHDKSTVSGASFDINNPPRSHYIHQPWPKLVYASADHPAHPPYKAVADEDEHEAAMAAGWLNEPAGAAEDEEIELDPELAAEAADVDAKLAKLRAEAKKKKAAAAKASKK